MGFNAEMLLKSGRPLDELVEIACQIPSFEKLLEHVQSGDEAAAKNILAIASAYLLSDVHGPMPLELRRHIGIALAKASLGERADVVFGLKSLRKPRRSMSIDLQIAACIYRAMRLEKRTLESASAYLAVRIKREILHQRTLPKDVSNTQEVKVFGYSKPPDSKTLQGIYNRMLPTLRAIYAEFTSKTSSVSELSSS